jgi:hypothetical protein
VEINSISLIQKKALKKLEPDVFENINMLSRVSETIKIFNKKTGMKQTMGTQKSPFGSRNFIKSEAQLLDPQVCKSLPDEGMVKKRKNFQQSSSPTLKQSYSKDSPAKNYAN